MPDVIVTIADMSATRKPKKTAKKGRELPASLLEREAFLLKRRLLRETLESVGWSLTLAVKPLGMSKPNILRAIRQLDLETLYEQNRLKPGPRPKS